MKITRIAAYRRNLALTKPYTVAFDTFSDVENIFLEIELEDGTLGLGSAAASIFVLNQTIEETEQKLQSEQLQNWIGRDIRHFRALIEESKLWFPFHSAARTAIDIALHDAFGKYLGIPVVDLYGRFHKAIPTSVTIGICSLEETLEEARQYKAAGFRVLKVKTGLNIEEDIERCAKLRETFGSHFTIRVDANQGYTAEQTIAFAKATGQVGIELIEQPMPVGTEDQMRLLPEELRNRIACDESLKTAKSAVELLAPPAVCGIFNIKLMKCGGISGALEIATIARAAGVELFWGCFDESIISITAALHAAFACPSTRYLDLDGSLDLAEDLVTGGFVIEDGVMRTLDKPGLGCELIHLR